VRVFIKPNTPDTDPFEARRKRAHLKQLIQEFGAVAIDDDTESFTVRLASLDKASLAHFLEAAEARGVALGPEDASLLANGDPLGTRAVEAEMASPDYDGMALVDELSARIDHLGAALWRVPADSEEGKVFDSLLAEIEAPAPTLPAQVDDWSAALALTPEQAELERRLLEENLAACNADPSGIIRY
jgi:hypothetical protein